MILKKPYAFLIKHFKLIHAILTVFLVICSYKFLNITSFFNRYVQSGYKTSVTSDLEKIYTPFSVFLLVFLILVILITILVLLIHKKKPNKLYLLMVIYYLVMFFGLFYINSVLIGFEKTLLASTIARSIRDILLIYNLPQFIFIVYTFIRAIGFNLRKFDFVSDLKEMNFSAKDAEEFELNINFNSYKAERGIRRFYREIIYYIKENKFIVICILVVAIIILLVFIYNNMHGNYDKTYQMNKQFTYNKLNVTILDSMISNLDYNGNEIKPGKYYLVVKINVINNSGYVVKMDYNNFKLDVAGNLINPTINMASNFIDYAPSTVPLSISHKSDLTFGLVYELDSNQINKNMKLEIYNGSIYEKNEYINKHIYVNIKTNKLSSVKNNGNYQLNEQIVFDDTYLDDTSLIVEEFKILKSYLYTYEKCKNEVCETYNDLITVPVKDNRQNNVLLILKTNFYQDSTSLYTKSYESLSAFVQNFVDIKYRVNDTVYDENVINVTPTNVDNVIVLEVPSQIESADVIQCIITIRNYKYILNLKS